MPQRPEEITEAEWDVVWRMIEPVAVNDLLVFRDLAAALANHEGVDRTQAHRNQAKRLGRSIGTLVGGDNPFPIEFLGDYQSPLLVNVGNRLTWDGHPTEPRVHTDRGNKIIYRKTHDTHRDD
jgi:hypothetical protein